jgi:hypothetical protein
LTEENLTVNDRNSDRRLAYQQLATMRMTVDELIFLEVLSADGMIVMLVVCVLGNEVADETAIVVEETGLRLVDNDRCGRMWAIYSHLSVTNPGARHNVTG